MSRFVKVGNIIVSVDKIQYILLNGEVLSIVCLHDTKNIRFPFSSVAEENFDYLAEILISETPEQKKTVVAERLDGSLVEIDEYGKFIKRTTCK